MGEYDFINLFRNMGVNITSDAEYEVPSSYEMTIRGSKLVDYHPSVYPGNMTKVRVPSGIKIIGSNCFTGPDITHNDYMAGCILPEGVTELEDEAFALCRGMTEISIPSTLKKIGSGVFMYSSIKSITLPEGLESIGDYAFSSCRSLNELRIPSTVTEIGESCFINMGKPLMSLMFGGDAEGGTLYVPDALKDKYSEDYLGGSYGIKINWYKGGIKSKVNKTSGVSNTKQSSVNTKKQKKQEVFQPGQFPIAEVEASRKRLLDRKPKKTDGPNRFDLHLKCEKASSGVSLYYYDRVWPGYANKKADLLKNADELVKLFRDDSVESDVESELRQGYIRKGRTLHVLRSFVWTLVEYCNIRKEDFTDFGIEQYIDLAQFIFDRGGANYKPADKKTKRIGAGLLTKSEKDHGYSEESYINMVNSLHALIPVMKIIHSHLSEKSEELSDADTTLKDILAGWCAYSLACFTEFEVEAGPVDFVPDKLRVLPEDTGKLKVISKYYYVDQNNTCVAYTGSGDTIEFPEGIERIDIPSKFSHISGAKEYWNHNGTLICPKSYVSDSYIYIDFSKYIKRLVIKSDFDTFKAKSSYPDDPVMLEQIEFLGKGNTIVQWSFDHYENLKRVVLPENLTVIEYDAFYDTPLLKEVNIPPNVRKIGDLSFCQYLTESSYFTYKGGIKTLIVEKGSPAESVVRKHVTGRKDLTCKVVLSEAEQKRIDEENRLKGTAAKLQQKLMSLYNDRLDESSLASLKSSIRANIESMCDKQTWSELQKRSITALPTAYLRDTCSKIKAAASVEEVYDMLPEWISIEYVKKAGEKRKLNSFELMLRDLRRISEESVLPAFEAGIDKNEILGQVISKAKGIIGDSTLLAECVSEYDSNSVLETLRLSLGRKPFDSAETLVDAITEKKSAEFDKLTSLLEKKNEAIEAIQKEKAKLEEERSHLGLFHGKRKKEIAAILEKIPERIKQAEDYYEKAKNAV